MRSILKNVSVKNKQLTLLNAYRKKEECSTVGPTSFTFNGPNIRKKKPSKRFGFMFDIDGVFVRGKEVFSHSAEALQLLLDGNGDFKVPTVFVTNAGNTLRSKKAEQLSERIGVKIDQEQIVMSHSPLKMFQQFQNKTVLVSGQGPVREIAKNLGFKKVVTVDNLRRCYPLLDMVDHHNRGHEEADDEYFPEIEAVILFGEPVRWETNLQLITDLLMTNGKPDHSPSTVPESHIPVLACNMDMVWMAEACMPRFGHGCFLYCLEHLYKKLSGRDLKYTALIGKPSPITYHHAEYCLNEHAKSIGIQKTISHLYCVGDNPDTDIYGANLYSRYLRSKQRHAEVSSIGKRSKMMLGAPAHIENGTSVDEINEEELLDTAENCQSILVNTGVYSADSGLAYGTGVSSHVDFAIEDDLRKPDHMAANVLEAVQLVLAKEGVLDSS